MLIYDLIVFFVFVGLLLLTTPLLGNYIARIFSSDLLPGESLIYRLLGVDYKKEMSWVEINDADSKNIAKRWINYILDPSKSGDKFYFYALGINISKLNIEEFDTEDEFNSIYNRFFRSALLYALKTFFFRQANYCKKYISRNRTAERSQIFSLALHI